MRRIILFISLLLFSASSFAQESEWLAITSDECNFSVEMPVEPKIESNSRTVQGQTITSHKMNAKDGWVMYVVDCSDYPIAKMLDTKQKVLDVLKSSAERRARQVPDELKEIELDGYHGIEYVSRMGDSAIYHRVYMVGDKLFQLDVGDLEGNNREQAERFFTSFSLN